MIKQFVRLLLIFWVVGGFAQQYDILIGNGRVVDGAGNPWIYADIAVTGDHIVLVGKAPAGATARRVIDAKGLIVAPGFIDMLEQSEWNLFIDKQAFSKLTQGITTGITGEGGSIAPQNDETIADRRDFLEHYHLTVDWRDLDGYFRRLEKQESGINLGTYVGATQVRRCVIGSVDRAPTAEELTRMKDPQVRAAIRQELAGVSGSNENMWRGTGGPQGILISSVLDPALKNYEGKTIAQIAADEHKDPLDALMDLVVAGKDHVSAVYFTMNEDDVRFAMQQPFVSVGTDAGAANVQGP